METERERQRERDREREAERERQRARETEGERETQSSNKRWTRSGDWPIHIIVGDDIIPWPQCQHGREERIEIACIHFPTILLDVIFLSDDKCSPEATIVSVQAVVRHGLVSECSTFGIYRRVVGRGHDPTRQSEPLEERKRNNSPKRTQRRSKKALPGEYEPRHWLCEDLQWVRSDRKERRITRAHWPQWTNPWR
jgi:hypothetical protein